MENRLNSFRADFMLANSFYSTKSGAITTTAV